MFQLIPAPLHRTALRSAHRLRKIWWRWRRPELHGCRVLAFNAQGQLLLIRHSYGSGQWMPPGGGMGRGESPIEAALRELSEETGCILREAVEIAHIEEALHGARNHVHIVGGRTVSTPMPDRREVLEAAFFSTDALPAQMPRFLAEGLPLWIEAWITAEKAAHHQDAAGLHPAPLPKPKA